MLHTSIDDGVLGTHFEKQYCRQSKNSVILCHLFVVNLDEINSSTVCFVVYMLYLGENTCALLAVVTVWTAGLSSKQCDFVSFCFKIKTSVAKL